MGNAGGTLATSIKGKNDGIIRFESASIPLNSTQNSAFAVVERNNEAWLCCVLQPRPISPRGIRGNKHIFPTDVIIT